MSAEPQGVVPMLAYRDGAAAMDWLAEAFGFVERERWLDDAGSLTHEEMFTGAGLVMLASGPPRYESPRLHRSHCDVGPTGSRLYRTEDVEGHRWMFMQRGD